MPRGKIGLCLLFLIVAASGLAAADPPPPDLPDITAYVTGASHIDVEWKWRYQEAIDLSSRTFRAVLDIMDDYDDYPGGNPVYFTQSNALLYKEMADQYPEIFARIKTRVAEGRWEIVGGMWVESDANLPCGESFFRQLFYGKQYFRETFDVDVDTGWLPDSFGYNANLPQFFRLAGIENFFYYKTNWNDTHPPTQHTFWWEAPDGSRVLAHLSMEHYNNQMFMATFGPVMQNAAAKNPNQTTFLYPIGMGDHGGGIGRRNINVAITLAEQGWPIEFAKAGQLFDALDTDTITDVISDELYFERHRGTYTSRTKHKREVRALEYGLRGSEAIRTRAALNGATLAIEPIQQVWKTLMVDQFHDTMAGTCWEPVYAIDVAARNEAAFESLRDQTTEGMLRLAGGGYASHNVPGEGWFALYNPFGFALTAPVLVPLSADRAGSLALFDAGGQPLACQPDADGRGVWMIADQVPAYGWSTYQLVPGACSREAPYPANDTQLQNAFLDLSLSTETGLLQSLVSDQLGGRELIQPGSPGNLLEIYHDHPIPFDSWDIGFDKYKDAPIESLTEATDISLIETGPVRSVIRVTRQGEIEDYRQDVILYYDLPRVDFSTTVFGWGQKGRRFLKVAFPLELQNDDKTVTTEIPYGSITRVLDGSVANWEFAGHKWADLTENAGGKTTGPGVALLSRDKYGYDVANDGPGQGLSDGQANVLRLSLLKRGRAPTYLLFQSGGPITDRGDFENHYALYPHAGDAAQANMLKVGHEYYAPLQLRFFGKSKPPALPALFELTPDNALGLWLKTPEVDPVPGQALIRVVESRGDPITAKIEFFEKTVSKASVVNLMEEPVDQETTVSGGNTVEFALGAHQVLTLLVTFESEDVPVDDDDDNDSVDDDTGDDDSGDDDDDDRCGC